MSSALLVVDVAAAVALLGIVAVMSGRLSAAGNDLSIPDDRMLAATLTISRIGAPDEPDPAEFAARLGETQRELVRRLEAEPGVRGVAVASHLPHELHSDRWIEVEGEDAPADSRGHLLEIAYVDPGFFEALGQPILAGRGFDLADLGEDRSAVIVNTMFVDRVLGGRNPIGRRVRYEPRGDEPGPWYEIVGVVGDLGMSNVKSFDQGMYHPAAPGEINPLRLAIHVGGDPVSFTPRRSVTSTSAYLADGGVGRDGIPALTDPQFVPAEPRTEANSYFRDTDQVIAYWNGGEWLVIPHNVMWRHEIVNLPEAAVTYCPLTGSALAFSRGEVDGAEFGVSGLLYKANLILYDRNEPDESLWAQMLGEARCGPRTGEALTPIPVIEMTWEGWVELHPDSKVLALTEDMFDPALYFFSPYGFDYEDPDNPDFFGFPISLNPRRPPKERVLGLPGGDGPIAYPFEAMGEVGDLAVFELEHAGEPVVVFWDATRRAAMAYRPVVDGEEARFRVTEQGIVDDVTGTAWAVDGTPLAGPLAGTRRRLDRIDEAYVAFWGAWPRSTPIRSSLSEGRAGSHFSGATRGRGRRDRRTTASPYILRKMSSPLRASLSLWSVPAVLWATGLSGQVVQGRVTASESRAPIHGAFVRLLDGSGRQRAAVLTNASGHYRLEAPESGTFRLRAEFIGRETAESGTVELGADAPLDWSPALSPRPVEIAGLTVEGERRCRVSPEEGSVTAELWDEARKALEVALWAEDRELFRYRIRTFRRELDPERRRVVDERTRNRTGYFRRPFASRPAASLVSEGFVQHTDRGSFAYAPDARVLLADAFLETHCFRARRAGDGEGVGLAFEPTRDRRVPDVRGVMWLDPATAELRSVTYRYVRFPGLPEGEELGGRVDFERLPTGAWIVRRWKLEMPTVGEVVERGVVDATGRRLVGVVEEGGEVVEVVDAEGTTVLAADRATLVGAVHDSVRAGPLVGAEVRLQGTGHRTVTGDDGTFLLADLPGGSYSLVVRHPALDSLGIELPPRLVELEVGRTTRVSVGVPTEVPAPDGAGPTAAGRVTDPDTGEPVPAALVSLVDRSDVVRGTAVTDTDGSYTVTAPRPGRYRVRVEGVGRETFETSPLPLREGRRRVQSLQIRRGPAPLRGVDPHAREPCRSRPTPTSATGRAWEEARKALATLVGAQDAERFEYQIVLYEREGSRGTPERLETVDRPVTHTFGHVPLRSDGRPVFVELGDSSLSAAVPGPRFLSSSRFADRYCLRIAAAAADSAAVAVAFEPLDPGELPDVSGLLVLDRHSGALRSLHYRYVNFPGPVGPSVPGGWIAFERLPEGPFFVSAWERRLPQLVWLRSVDDIRPREPSVAFELVRGGYVTEARGASAEGAVVWNRASSGPDDATAARMWALGSELDRRSAARPARVREDAGPEPPGRAPSALRLAGAVEDEETGRPVVGAVVRIGDDVELLTDESGRFEADRIRPGRHRIEVDAPGLEPLVDTVALEADGPSFSGSVSGRPRSSSTP